MLMVLALFYAMTIQVLATDYNVGVKPGDWIRYDCTTSGVSGVPDLNPIQWFKADITGVNGTTIRMTLTLHRKNGTENSDNIVFDIKSVQVTGPYGMMMAIGANLKRGDQFSPELLSGDRLNDTVSRLYAGATRSANVFDASYNGGRQRYMGYWDQATGIMVELYQHVDDDTFGEYTEFIKVTETNMWNHDLMWLFLDNLPAILIVAFAVIVVALLMNRRKNIRQRTDRQFNHPSR